jgi:antitoxin HicB
MSGWSKSSWASNKTAETAMEYRYYANIEPDPDGGFLVTFADVPEAITHGQDRTDALVSAKEALGLALRGYPYDEKEIPLPEAKEGVPVTVSADDALKIAVISAFRQAGISKSELAKRLGKAENEARRILDPDHATKLGLMQAALAALGKEVVITIKDAA